jgi:thiamine biosynthesis lipoprotein
MGTRLDIVFPGLGPELCDRVMVMITTELDRIERKLSIHSTVSELSVINATAYGGPVVMDEEFSQIFREIENLHRETLGYFDITMKPVSDCLVGEGKELPVDISDRVGMNKVAIDGGAIRFRKKGVILDPGGFGKGYAVRRLLMILESEGIERALISFGESLIYGLGTHPYGDSWRVSVPFEGFHEPVSFDLINESLSTSGNTLNNQKKFANSGHIVNPVTLQMSPALGLVSVKSKDPFRAEAFSTALFCAGPKQSEHIFKGLPDLEIRWILPDEKQNE